MIQTRKTHIANSASDGGGQTAEPGEAPGLRRSGDAAPGIAALLLTQASPHRAGKGVLEGLAAVLGVSASAVFHLAGDAVTCAASRGLDAAAHEDVLAFCRDGGQLTALRQGLLVISQSPASVGGGEHTLVVVPMMARESLTGWLALVYPSTRPVSAADQETMRLFAAIAATSLETGRVRAENTRRAKHLRALHEVGVAVSRELDLDGLYEAVHRETSRVLKVDAFYIALWEQEREIIRFPYSVDGDRYDIGDETGLNDGPCSWVIRNRRPFVLTEQSRDIQDTGDMFGGGGVSVSAMHVPMLLGERVVGVMSAQSYEADAYTDEDLQLFQMVAGQTAVAVENARLYQAVQDLSFTDELTGLPNRRAVLRRLEVGLAEAAREHQWYSVLMLDLDYFKKVNDTCGHAMGDAVLRELATLIGGLLSPSDTVGRWGGEEFIILLPRTSYRSGIAAAECLRAAIAAHPFAGNCVPLPQTVTIGGVAIRRRSPVSVEGLLDAVDRYLYRAKDAGRNRAHLAKWDREDRE
jgi:diguanylate cyclase (GGDEF)-like protein